MSKTGKEEGCHTFSCIGTEEMNSQEYSGTGLGQNVLHVPEIGARPVQVGVQTGLKRKFKTSSNKKEM
jgi:hypothetical protein